VPFMNSSASRRIKGKAPQGDRDKRVAETDRERRSRLPLYAAVSLAAHALGLAAYIYLPGLLHLRPKEVVMYSITMTTLPPGPMGGGGESQEVREPEKHAVKEPPKEEVKVAVKPTEKPSPNKKPEPVPAKPQAPVGPGQGPTGGGKEGVEAGPISYDGGIPFPDAWYIKLIEKKVREKWRPPALMGKAKPKAVIFFRIDRKGRIKDVTVETSSGIAFLDRSAISAVTDASPMPPLPAGFAGDTLGIHYTFIPETSG